DEFVEAVPVLEDSWVILTRRDSAIAELEQPGFEVLDEQDVVAWTHRWMAQFELEEALERRGNTPKGVYRAGDNPAPPRPGAAGLGPAGTRRAAARRGGAPPPTR